MVLPEVISSIAASLGMSEKTILVLLLVLFLLLANFAFASFRNTIFIGMISAVFPFFAVSLLGIDLALNTETVLYFVFLGTGLYHVYELTRIVLHGSHFLVTVVHGMVLPFVWLWKLIKKILGIK